MEFRRTAVPTEARDQTVPCRLHQLRDQQLRDLVRLEESLRTVVPTVARGQTVLFRLPLQVVLTGEFLRTAVRTVDKDPTV